MYIDGKPFGLVPYLRTVLYSTTVLVSTVSCALVNVQLIVHVIVPVAVLYELIATMQEKDMVFRYTPLYLMLDCFNTNYRS